MKESALTFLISLGMMHLTALVPLAWYSVSKARARKVDAEGKELKSDWTVKAFVIRSRTRLMLGSFVMLLLAIIVTLQPEARSLIPIAINWIASLLGYPPLMALSKIDDVVLGFLTGGFLVTAVRGDDK